VSPIKIYTDGACSGNPGPGGYGVILTHKNYRKELSQGFLKTTNNRMELLAVIAGLEALKKNYLDVLIVTDSQYVVDAVTKGWLFKWEIKNFKDKKNGDLWKRFLEIFRKQNVKFQWIRGHAGHIENERCDQLAVKACRGKNLLDDYGFTGFF